MYCVTLKLSFRLENAPKRIFWSIDHQTDDEIIELAYPAIKKAKTSLNTAKARADFLAEYKKAKLALIAKCPHLTNYEMVQTDQLPSKDLSLAAWLIRNQTRAFATEEITFMDFRAPIELEALVVPRNLL